MKRYRNKKIIIVASVLLLLLTAVGVTLAYVFTATKPVENAFTPSQVSCAVVENGRDPVSGSLVNMSAPKENVQIINTGNTDAYIRVAVVVNWMNEDGSRVWAQRPIKDTDYTITYNLAKGGWFDGGDGFYYYSKAVSSTSPDNLTDILITNAALISGVTAPVGTDNTQYYLSIEIVASAIQAVPASTVSEQWGVTVSDDGTISK